ncbi:MAG TPA: tetratricopeptide repeat protein [Bacteroidia bacterium]|nr:tetratricopeptide repeat protein [Bacteroidia bacterium]HNT80120.1 tetratricopeptide repeat protein [Bacteroidia bacterium]
MSKRKILYLCICIITIAACNPSEQKENNSEDVDFETRLKQLNEEIEKNPQSGLAYYNRSKLYFDHQKLSESVLDIRRAMQYDSTNADIHYLYADLSFMSNRLREAKEGFEKCIALNPTHRDAIVKLGEMYYYLREYQRALDLANDALKLDVHFERAYFLKGMVYKETGDTVRAISSFQTAVEQNTQYLNAFMQLALIHMAKKNIVALDYLNSALRINPRSEEALYARGLYFQENGELDKAISDYTNLVLIDPGHRSAHFNLGYIHYNYLGLNDEAIKHYEKALQADSTYAEAMYNMGLCYEARGEINTAKSLYSKALIIKPGYELPANGLQRLK